jgi:hypothetical protein
MGAIAEKREFAGLRFIENVRGFLYIPAVIVVGR